MDKKLSNDHAGSDAPEVIQAYNPPEVVPQSHSGLIAVPKEEEGLQVFDNQQAWTSREYEREKVAVSRPAQKRRLIWIIAVIVLAAVIVALAAGLGVSLSQKEDDNGGSGSAVTDNGTEGTTASSPTGSVTSSSTTSLLATGTATSQLTSAALASSSTTQSPSQISSATISAVTSGTTGLAAFSCTNGTEVSSSSNTLYTEECYVQYFTNNPSFYDRSRLTSRCGDPLTVYSIQQCLDACDAYKNIPACRALTYYANITNAVNSWGGNCILKSDRSDAARTDEDVDYEHTVSAFQSCLQDGSCIGA